MASQSSLQSPRDSSPASAVSSTGASMITAPEEQEEDGIKIKPVAVSKPSIVLPTALKIPPRIQPGGGRSGSKSPSSRARSSNDPYPLFLLQSKQEIRSRFLELERYSTELCERHKIASDTKPYGNHTQEVASRNRYGNVEVYHDQRIILSVPEGQSDYINASPIILERFKDDEHASCYIAAQGPKMETEGHFWHMMWEESTDTAVIIMLTKVFEENREKCHDYLPDQTPKPIYVQWKPKVRMPRSAEEGGPEGPPAQPSIDYTILPGSSSRGTNTGCWHREFVLRKESSQETRKIMHFAFESWPDHSVPEGIYRKHLSNLVHEIHSLAALHPDSPRVVHCSAGIGRTGTFIAMDFLFRLLKEQRVKSSLLGPDEDPIHETVAKLREQRMMMVQGEAQYQLIYDIVREELERLWDSGELPKEQ